MSSLARYLATFVLFGTVPLVLLLCTENRYETTDRAEDFSWYTPTAFNSSSSDCECGDEFACVRKCCDVGYVVDENFTCIYDNRTDFKVNIYHFRNVIVEDNSVRVRFTAGVSPCMWDDDDYAVDDFKSSFIQKDGRLWLSVIDTFFEREHYCIEEMDDGTKVSAFCILKYDIQGLVVSERLTVIGMMISLPFLFVTFVVYAVLPLRNLHGQALMCYVFSLFTTYFAMVFIVLYPDSDELSAPACKTLAMTLYFFFVASFFWMNVMCIDIYLTFSGSRGFPGTRKKAERRRFLLYSAYAWGSPLALVALILIVSFTVKPNRWYNPGVADQQCWLNDGIPTFIYMYLPMAILIIANIVLFTITACKIRQVQQDTAMLRSGDSKTSKKEDEQIRFCVYLKLFLAMGVNWSLEIISWAIKWQVEHVPHAVWYVTEFCNAAFGVFIFFIFVVNKKTWTLLKARYYQLRGQPLPNRIDSTYTTNTRSSTK